MGNRNSTRTFDGSSLPAELWQHIASFLRRVAVKRFRLVCRQWNALAPFTIDLREMEVVQVDDKRVMLKAKFGRREKERLLKCSFAQLTGLFNRIRFKHIVGDGERKTECWLVVSGKIGDRILHCFARSNLAPVELSIFGSGNLPNLSPAIAQFHRNKKGSNRRHELWLAMTADSAGRLVDFLLEPHLTDLSIDGQHQLTWYGLAEWMRNDSPCDRCIMLDAFPWQKNTVELNVYWIEWLVMAWKQMAIETKRGQINSHWHTSCVYFRFMAIIHFSTTLLRRNLALRWSPSDSIDRYEIQKKEGSVVILSTIGKLRLKVTLFRVHDQC